MKTVKIQYLLVLNLHELKYWGVGCNPAKPANEVSTFSLAKTWLAS